MWITVLFVFMLLLLLAAMTAGVWTWTQYGWEPRYVPIVAVLFLALVALVNLVSGHVVAGLLLGALAYLWTSWIAEIKPPSISELAGRLGRAVKAAATAVRRSRPRADRSPKPGSGPQPWRGLPSPSVPTGHADAQNGNFRRRVTTREPAGPTVARDLGAASGPPIRSMPRSVAPTPRAGTAPPLNRPPTGTSPRRHRRRRTSRPGTVRLWRAIRH